TMSNDNVIGQNVARLRLDRSMSQDEVASRAHISRLALGKIERGEVVPRAETLNALARALGTSTAQLGSSIRPFVPVRVGARQQVKGREQIWAEVSRWLEGYCWLEEELQERQEFPLEALRVERTKPETLAKRAREKLGLDVKEPVRDICGLLEETGVKV